MPTHTPFSYLCNGRYDNPQHPIFRTLQTLHADDYHNPTFTGSVNGCPREPWHYLHSKIDGPAAYDIMTNFDERWIKASKPRSIKKLKATSDALLKLEKFPEILGANDESCLSDEDPEGWHVQIILLPVADYIAKRTKEKHCCQFHYIQFVIVYLTNTP